MKQTHPSYRGYLAIWGWLMALLVAGTFASGLSISKGQIILIILGVSLVKAALVSLFYMHLKFEKLVPLWIIVVFPFFLIGMAALLVLIPIG